MHKLGCWFNLESSPGSSEASRITVWSMIALGGQRLGGNQRPEKFSLVSSSV